jgi:hypothetical protein
MALIGAREPIRVFYCGKCTENLIKVKGCWLVSTSDFAVDNCVVGLAIADTIPWLTVQPSRSKFNRASYPHSHVDNLLITVLGVPATSLFMAVTQPFQRGFSIQ